LIRNFHCYFSSDIYIWR